MTIEKLAELNIEEWKKSGIPVTENSLQTLINHYYSIAEFDDGMVFIPMWVENSIRTVSNRQKELIQTS